MKNTKKIISLVVACVMLALAALCFSACGAGKGPFVYVTVADENGEIVARYEKVAFTDGMTVDDALAALHEKKCKGGYASEGTTYGISMVKLWGIENGGAYGYYVNNASPASLASEISENDHIYAFIYTDTAAFSDTYAFFSAPTAEISAGASLSLTLSCTGYDASWTEISLPVADAKILIDGAATSYTTDENGKTALIFEKAGTYIVSAESETQNLVTPFVIVTVK